MELFAYLDPGSASALLAAVLAGVAGLGAAIRTYGTSFLSKILFWRKDEVEGDAPAVGEPEAGEVAEPGGQDDSASGRAKAGEPTDRG